MRTAATSRRASLPSLVFKKCPRCGRVMPEGNGATLCMECASNDPKSRVRERDYAAEYAKRRDSENPIYRKFYRSKEWTLLSRKYAHDAGYRCEECGDIGTDVHHVMPIQTDEGWARRFDASNLRLLCVRCHNAAHGRTFGNGWHDGRGREAEEAERAAQGPPLDRGEGREAGSGGGRKVSDYRLRMP